MPSHLSVPFGVLWPTKIPEVSPTFKGFDTATAKTVEVAYMRANRRERIRKEEEENIRRWDSG